MPSQVAKQQIMDKLFQKMNFRLNNCVILHSKICENISLNFQPLFGL